MPEQDLPDRRHDFAEALLKELDEEFLRTLIQLVREHFELYGAWLSVRQLKGYVQKLP
jgi:hypothetical protein